MNDHFPHLLDLIRLGKRAARLEVQDLVHVRTREDMVTASYPLREAETQEESLQIGEPDVGIR